MGRRQPKTAVVAFKVEADLAEFLNKLPNKSAFIRKAISSQLGMACHYVMAGVSFRGVHDHYANLLPKLNQSHYDDCGTKPPFAARFGRLSSEEHSRLEQFSHGGPLYCDPCYEKAGQCDDCGWHIATDHVTEHHKQVTRMQ